MNKPSDKFKEKAWSLNPLHSVERQGVLYTVEFGAMFKLELSS